MFPTTEMPIGSKWGRWMITSEAICRRPLSEKKGQLYYKCRCECGVEREVLGHSLRTGASRSCGCMRREEVIKRAFKHGGFGTRLYVTWMDMKHRCTIPGIKAYKNYGARGITVCDEWMNSFPAFREWAMENGYNDTLTIDRINPEGNYEPSNCRLVTKHEQWENRRPISHPYLGGKRLNIKGLARELGVPYSSFIKKLQHGMPLQDAIEYMLNRDKNKAV